MSVGSGDDKEQVFERYNKLNVLCWSMKNIPKILRIADNLISTYPCFVVTILWNVEFHCLENEDIDQ